MKFKNILYTLLFFPAFLFSQHSIKISFSPAEDYNWAILYKNSPTEDLYVAQGKIENGNLTFTLDSTATKGIYKVVYAAPQHVYNFDVIYNSEEDIELTFNMTEGAIFKKSNENILLNNYLGEFMDLGEKLDAIYKQPRIDTTAIVDIYTRQRELQNTYERNSEGKIVTHFIKANHPYIPKKYETPDQYIKNYMRNNFNHVDFTDPILQSSNLLQEKSLIYILSNIVEETNNQNSYNNNIDTILSLLQKTDPLYQKAFLDNLWQKLISYKYDETANYLAIKGLIPISKELNDTKLVLKLTQYINLSIGSVAPNFSWETFENGNTKTHQLNELAVAENYILIFWSSACSHCLKEIPLLRDFAQTLDGTKYKVMAIGLEDSAEPWKKEIEKYPAFIHVLKLKKWDNTIVNNYGLTSTPTYFVLDRDKKFIAKPKNLEELKLFIKK